MITLTDDIVLADDPHSVREDWLIAALAAIRPMFTSQGHPLPDSIRVTCGFPSTASRSGTLAELIPASMSRDGTVEVMISPVLDSPSEVLAALVAILCRAPEGVKATGPTYPALARSMGLEPMDQRWKSSRWADGAAAVYAPVLQSLGRYPHAAVLVSDGKTKQTTRMLKAACADPTCGYTVRLTAKWATLGLPTCYCGSAFTLEAKE